MGMCVAGGAYLPVMCDHILMTEGSGLFLAGPALVQAAIGQKISAEELGGAQTCTPQISGTVDFREPDDESLHRSASARWWIRWATAARRLLSSPPPEPPLYPRRGALRHLRRPIPRGNTTCERSSRASWTAAASTSTGPSTGRRCCAATPASAVAPSASSPTRSSTCGQVDPPRQQAHRVRRRHLHRERREGRALHHGLQPEP